MNDHDHDEEAGQVVDLVRVQAVLARMDARLAANPELAARTAAMLAGDLPAPDLDPEDRPTMTPPSPVNIRLPQAIIDRLDALVPQAGRAAELATMTRITRSDVLRLALLRGLAALELELVDGEPADA